MTLGFLRSISQVFCRMFLRLGLSYVFLMIRLGLKIFIKSHRGSVPFLSLPNRMCMIIHEISRDVDLHRLPKMAFIFQASPPEVGCFSVSLTLFFES